MEEVFQGALGESKVPPLKDRWTEDGMIFGDFLQKVRRIECIYIIIIGKWENITRDSPSLPPPPAPKNTNKFTYVTNIFPTPQTFERYYEHNKK